MTVADRIPRLWTLWMAGRPSQLVLIGLVYMLGVGMGDALTHPGTRSWFRIGVGAAVLFPIAVSIHYANEYADVETDRLTEQTPFSGGSGALARSGVSRKLLAWATAGTLTVGAGAGIVGWQLGLLPTTAAILLSVTAVAGLAYSLPPVALIRRGVGELTNALLGGLILPLYGVAVVGRVTAVTILAVVPFTMLVGCNLLATHWPDRKADAAVGKRTLAVRWSPRTLRQGYWTLAGLAILTTGSLATRFLSQTVVVAQTLALPLLLWGGVVLTRQRSPFPAVGAMVVHAGASTVAWWWLALS